MTSLHGRDRGRYQVATLCRLFGRTKQAYYKETGSQADKEAGEEEEVMQYCRSVREIDGGIGGRKLWLMYVKSMRHIGRDRFESILADNGLKLRQKRRRTRTTDSRHGLPTYPNLVYDLVPTRPDEVWVSDITYIPLYQADGTYIFCYLSIVMDSYTRQILGYSAGPTLSTDYPLLALQMAMGRRIKEGKSLTGIIHHSDRGIQYASAEYVSALKKHGMAVSMTESGNPKDNPQAERVNGIVKNELLKGCVFSRLSQVREELDRRVPFYNSRRPHMSLGMKTPDEAATGSGPLRKLWFCRRDLAIENAKKTPECLPIPEKVVPLPMGGSPSGYALSQPSHRHIPDI